MSRLPPVVRTPLRQQWRLLRYQFLPVAVFLGALGATGWLWGQHVRWPDALGEVEAVRVDVISPTDGLTLSNASRRWELLDRVRAGQVIARLDDGPALAELEALQADLDELRAELAAAEQRFALEHHDRRLERMVEDQRRIVEALRARLDVLDRETLLEADRIEQQRLGERLQIVQQLFERNAAAALELLDAQREHEVVGARVRASEVALAEAREQSESADARYGELVPLPDAALARDLEPIRAAIVAQHARVRGAQLRTSQLVLYAPMDGSIVAIHHWAGTMLRAGDPVVTIAADEGRYVVGYIRESDRFRPEAGMRAVVRAVGSPAQSARSAIDRVGPHVERIPPRHLRDVNRPEWGQPFRVALPEELDLMPGQLVHIRFERASEEG